MVVFRSLLVPAEGRDHGRLVGGRRRRIVAIFQWGRAGDIIGIGRKGPIEAWVADDDVRYPLLRLSMDYEVFLLHVVREENLDHGDKGSGGDGLLAERGSFRRGGVS